ncbi:MAG: ABC transporter substrate-binding protein, partial [Gammaproteobacteria bacterium]|nr:ABC transporter substrate-binding protein [Gammaproteobacteria bacterium]
MRKSLSLLTAAVAAMPLATAAHAETIKVGMITNLTGGGAALGIDER